mgnify:CR=1 FL=1
MKKSILFFVAVLSLAACKTDLTEIDRQIKEAQDQVQGLANSNRELKEEADALKRKGEELDEQARKRQEENEKIQQRLQDLEDTLNEPQLLTMEFLSSDNPLQLIENTPCTIIGDSVVECRILNVTSEKVLIPRFTFKGSVVTIEGVEAESGVTAFDFTNPVVLSIITPKKIKDYRVYVTSYTGLPTVWLETNGHINITNANQYYGGIIKVIGNPTTRSGNGVTQASVKIMGLSPIRWYQSDYILSNSNAMLLAKNTYVLKFNNDISLLGDPNGTTWGLYPHLDDLTFLHNQTAYYLGEISNLDYTPRGHFVDMFFNSRYFGTYGFVERPEISRDKVNVGDDGFILSIGSDESGSTFSVDRIDRKVTILAPAVPSSEALSYVSNFVDEAEEVLFSSYFTDETSGWQKYMDMDSFVDWYLINEIAKNQDGAFQTNCLMNLERGGKLKMGPLWDFEDAFGDISNTSYNGFVIKNVSWYARLFQDPAFVARVKERYDYFYDHRQDILAEISANAEYLKYSIQENDNRWEYLAAYKSYTSDTWAIYGSLVANMKYWLASRMDWLKGEFDAMA